MEKIDRIINIVRNLKEEMAGMTTGSSGETAGFSSKSPAEGPTAGFDPLMGKKKKDGTVDFRRIRSLHKHWVKSLDK